MDSHPDGLNKRFDRLLKAFADEAPRLFLHVFDVAPIDVDVQLSPLRAETAPSIVLPDYVAVLTIASGEPFTFHVEFYLDYASHIPRTMARYGGSLAWQYQRLVVSILMLLRRDRAPDAIPTTGEYSIGHTRTTHPYKVVRTWEVDPTPVLETHDPRMFPWAILMNSTDEQVSRIAAALRSHGDDESIARFLTLGSLRYDRNELETMLGGTRMGLVEAILEGSSLVKEAKDKAAEQGRAEGLAEGLAEGRAKGRAEGRAEGARRVLRICLRSRFPTLEAMPEIDAISRIEAIEALLQRVLMSASQDEIQREILAIARESR